MVISVVEVAVVTLKAQPILLEALLRMEITLQRALVLTAVLVVEVK